MFDRRMREVSTGTGSVGLLVMEHHCQVLIIENDQTDLWTKSWKMSLKTTPLRLFLSDLLQNDCSQSLHAHHLNILPSMATPDAAVTSSGRAVLKRQFVWIMHVGWCGLFLNSSCCRHLLVFTGIAGGSGGIFDSRTSGRKDLRNCCDNTVTWKSFSEVVNRTKKMWNCSVTLFLICLLEATTSNRIRGIWILPLPFHTKLSWLPSHWFCEKSGFTAFHSYELASFFILSWIWLPTCSRSILSVQVSVGGRLIRGENQRTVVSLPFCLQNVRLLPSVTASRCDPPCTLHLTQPHFSLI